jgi:hypothetical protein
MLFNIAACISNGLLHLRGGQLICDGFVSKKTKFPRHNNEEFKE